MPDLISQLPSPSSRSPSAITLEEFLRTLLTTGAAQVASFSPDVPERGNGWAELTAELDAIRRAELGPQTPSLDAGAVQWAALRLYRACQFLVCRDVAAETVTRTLMAPFPHPRTPSTDYSVDLVMVMLPDLFDLAQPLAPQDPLVDGLRRLAREWPLSSVGIALNDMPPDAGALANPALQRLLADRVTARRAVDRLGDPRLRAQLRADAGLYPELLPLPASSYEPA